MKKGITSGTGNYIVLIIIAVILIIVGITYASTVGNRTKNYLLEQQCENSVLSHIKMLKLSKLSGKSIKETPIDCTRINITLDENDEEEIKYQLAEKMRICWKNWQRGEQELFVEKGTYCQPCYLVDFENKGLQIENFDKFLMSTNITGQDYTYEQYFVGGTNNENFAADNLLANPDIASMETNFSTEGRKVILFYYIKDSDAIKEIMEDLKNVGIGAGIGATSGAIVFGTAGGVICSALPGVGTIACAVGGAKIGAIIGGAAGAFIGGTFSNGYPLWLSYILIRDYNEEELEALGCEIAPGKQTNIYQN